MDTNERLSPADFDFGALLGEGSYARVYLATHKRTRARYAAKMVNMQQIVKLGKTKTVMREKKVLLMCRHPNIVRLHHTFRDKQTLYFMLELVSGGELFELIERMGKLDLPVARHFAAELVATLEYLHGKGVLHRDLKPENLLITSDFHLKLTDFGTAGFVKLSQTASRGGAASEKAGAKRPASEDKADSVHPGRFFEERKSCVGTAEYVSPEVLEGRSQTRACDLWSAGCVIYHMLVGRPPFKGKSEWLTMQQVKQANPEYPRHLSSASRDILSKLLVRDPEKRLGTRSMAQLKQHAFFKGVNWSNLHRAKPPSIDLTRAETGFDALSSTRLQPMDALAEDSDEVDFRATEVIRAVVDRKSIDTTSGVTTARESAASSREPSRQVGISFRPARAQLERSLSESNVWKAFLTSGEHVAFTGLIMKKSFRGVGLFSRKRQLILTTRPRLLYVDPQRMVVKGEIPWRSDISAHRKTRRNFEILSGKQRYRVTCLSHEADAWVKAISTAARIRQAS